MPARTTSGWGTLATAPPAAFVLAAGLGTRMRPLTDRMPKPLVRLAGRPLLDHVLDRLAAAGVGRVVVNVHYLADMIEGHVRGRTTPGVSISDERDALLDTGGGVRKAMHRLGSDPFLVLNSDTVWLESGGSNIGRLFDAFDADRMDGLLLLARRETSLGYAGRGDFNLAGDGRLARPGNGELVPYVFAGVSVATGRLMRDTPEGPFSLNRVWDRAIAEGRLFGLELAGTWMHVGDPEALAAAEALIAAADGKGAA